ncbi:uncharacterized protein LOC117650080 [Thrips palmi]|uniref:Uncharacterized protein LOC117650080 n=1 Tax=Thrips palmi TaxID=161013 RepID=A0A6P8ZVU3_THRPL|nr:uncharacterized protein LOC117650080 [Thrips palmi]
MGTSHVIVNKFLGSFGDVINMMMDLGLLSSHVFSYSVAQDMSNMLVEERHLQAYVKFLEEAKNMLNHLSNQMPHCRNKEGFGDLVLGFENRQNIVSDGISVNGPCNSSVKPHENSFSSSCGTTTYSQMKNAPSLEVPFNSATQQPYGNINESRCEIPSGRFSPLNEAEYTAADTLSHSRHYSVPDNSSCFDMSASSVAHENSLSSHGATFNLQSHMAVNSHFQPSCETAFDGSANQMMRFRSCNGDTSLKQFSSSAESQSHESQFVPHDKSEDFTSKPSCEFAQPNDTRDSHHYTSPRGHFSPTSESNCDTMYASRCETTQDAHFSCDTSYETSNHSGHGMHTTNVPFQTSSEQALNPHYSHPTISTETRFEDPIKNQHSSAFSMVNVMNTNQYPPCQSGSEKTQFITNEDAQTKMHYPSRNDMCDSSFTQLNGNTSFVGMNDVSCNTHITPRPVNENRFSHVWNGLSDTEESFDQSSPVPASNQSQESTEFGDLQMAFVNQVDKDISSAGFRRSSGEKDGLGSSGESSFSLLLGTKDVNSSSDVNKKKLSVLEGIKQDGNKWKCTICARFFIARVNIERHFRVQHLGEKAFPCSLCNKGFSSKIRLDAHLMRQHNLNCESANPCTVCGKLFNTKTALKTHSLTHVDESEKPFACNICNKRFSQKVVLDTHLVRHEGPASYKFQCKICNNSFPTKAKLQFHWKKHESTQFPCKECPKQFSNLSMLHAHEATHIDYDKRPYRCTKCPKTFTTKHKLHLHSQTHLTDGKYPCSECSAVFKCRATIAAHFRKKHDKTEGQECSNSDASSTFSITQAPPQLDSSDKIVSSSPLFKCTVCPKEFNRKFNLREHMTNCHQDMPPRFSCEHCLKRFKSKNKLRLHVATHTEEPNLACRTCGKRFYRTDLLRTHEATHTGNKPFSCEVCARRFATQSMLRSHQVIHQPPPEIAAQLPCPTCGKRFKNKKTLSTHAKCHADRQFKCGTCGKQFARKVHYDGHMRTHSADRPYSCTVCNRTYRERKHRADHMRRVHPNEVLGGGELTLQKLIDSITTDDTMDGSTGGGDFEPDVNSDALASLTELSNSGVGHLLEDSSQRNAESQVDETSQSQGSQLNCHFGSQSQNVTLESQVDCGNSSAQVNHMNQSYSSQTHEVDLDNQVNHIADSFTTQSESLSILQNPFHHLKAPTNDSNPFRCSGNGGLSPLPELSDHLQSMGAHTSLHPVLHDHFSNNEDKIIKQL